MGTVTDITQYKLARDRQEQETAQAAAAEQEAKEKPKQGIGWGTGILVLIFCIILDAIEFFTVGTVGILITIFGDFFLLLYAGMSKKSKGQFKKIVVAVLGEKIPFVSMLPIRSIVWIWGFIASHPEWLAKLGKKLSGVNKALQVASKIPSPVMPELQAAAKITQAASTAADAVNNNVNSPEKMKANLQAARVAPTQQERSQIAA